MPHSNAIETSGIWAVIPVYNNKATVVDVALKCRRHLAHVLVVDDGSTDTDVRGLFSGTDITVLRHERNRGKGAAISTALEYLHNRGARFMLTIDGDGQHDPEDIPRFIPLLNEDDPAIVVGVRDFDAPNVPGKSRFGRAFSNFWIQLETGESIADSQSGFRAYPVSYLARMKPGGRYYDFESEVLTRAAWSGLALRQVGISVFYPPAGLRVTSFRPFLDNLRISLMHMRLIGRRLLPLPYPRLIHRRAPAQPSVKIILNPRKLIRELLKENATPAGLAAAAGVGMFLGVLPLVSMHIISVLYVSSRLHLNKVMGLAVQNLCTPPFLPVACIEVGYFMLHRRWLTDISRETVFGQIQHRLWEWFLGSLILAPILSVIVAVAVFFSARAIQKKN